MNLDVDGDRAAVEGVGDAASHVPANPPRDEGHAGLLGILQVRGEGRAARRVGPEGAAVAAGHDEEHRRRRDALLLDRRERVDVLDGSRGDDLFALRTFLIFRAAWEPCDESPPDARKLNYGRDAGRRPPGEQRRHGTALVLGGDASVDRRVDDRLHLEHALLLRTARNDEIRSHVLAARARDLAADLRLLAGAGPDISQYRRPL